MEQSTSNCKKYSSLYTKGVSYSFLSTTFFYTKGIHGIDHRNNSITVYKNSSINFELKNIENSRGCENKVSFIVMYMYHLTKMLRI